MEHSKNSFKSIKYQTIAFGVVLLILIFCQGVSSCIRNSSHIITGKEIVTDKAMVVCAYPDAARIAAGVMADGGNAVDAAVATEFALAVCYPAAGNLGGGGFMVIRMADGTAEALDYRETAPAASGRDMYLDSAGNVIEGLSLDTHLGAGIPGTVDGLLRAHGKYGKLPLARLIQPAIDLAENGYQLTRSEADALNRMRATFTERNRAPVAFVRDEPWKEGDILKQPELAETLKRIRDNGRDGFYRGTTAELIVRESESGNGIITVDDLAGYSSRWRKPVTAFYKGYEIISMPPPSSGGIALLQLLKMTEQYNAGEMGFHSPQSMHLMIEAERRVYADRAEFLGDPDFVSTPVEGLLNSDYLRQRMSSFSLTSATPSAEVTHGDPMPYESEETTHYSIVDPLGNAVAGTTTLNNGFGSGIVVAGAGFILNDEMDDFSSKPGVPNMFGLVGGEANSIRPGKRMLSSMTPTVITKDGRLFMVVGSPGGSTIITSVYQVIVNVIDFRMPVSDAVKAGRFHHQWLPDRVDYEEERIDTVTIGNIRRLGHTVSPRGAIGRVDAVVIAPDGRLMGGADDRGDDVAAGF